jgi:hypothetical protein
MVLEGSMSANSNLSRKKYKHSEYDDLQIDALMQYFKFENYAELKWFLRSMGKTK